VAEALPDDIVTRMTDRLAEAVGPRRYAMWFDQSASFDFQPNQRSLQVAVPNQFAANWIERHLSTPLREVVDQQLGDDVTVDLKIAPRSFDGNGQLPANGSATGQTPIKPGTTAGHNGQVATVNQSDAVQPGRSTAQRAAGGAPMRHRLDDFIVGPSNELAYTAVRRLVEDEAAAGQPVFLHGGCGVGKTHLLQGLCHQMHQLQPEAKVLYTTGERFTNEYITAVRNNQLDRFRRAMRKLDLLAVDDVHFLANKQSTQKEFLHSFNEIELGGARLALASDSHPKWIEQFSEALVNRCVRGLVVRIDEPDAATRQKLIRALAQHRGLAIHDGAVTQLADHCQGSVREIEGLLTKLHALTTLDRGGGAYGGGNVNGTAEPIGRAKVDQLLAHDAPGAGPCGPVDFNTLRDTVACELGVEVSQITGSSRQKQVVLARSVLVHLARDLTSMSFPEIARALGRTNHSTTITAAKRMQRQIDAAEPLHLPGRREPISPSGLVQQIKRAVQSRC